MLILTDFNHTEDHVDTLGRVVVVLGGCPLLHPGLAVELLWIREEPRDPLLVFLEVLFHDCEEVVSFPCHALEEYGDVGLAAAAALSVGHGLAALLPLFHAAITLSKQNITNQKFQVSNSKRSIDVALFTLPA